MSRAMPGGRCGECRHYAAAPDDLERGIPGLVVMGSGYSAVRACDGLCRRHDRYLSANHGCAEHAPLPGGLAPRAAARAGDAVRSR